MTILQNEYLYYVIVQHCCRVMHTFMQHSNKNTPPHTFPVQISHLPWAALEKSAKNITN